jgi:hypothetical protein
MGASNNRSERFNGEAGISSSMLLACVAVSAWKRILPPFRDMGGSRSTAVRLYGEHHRPEIGVAGNSGDISPACEAVPAYKQVLPPYRATGPRSRLLEVSQ